MNDEEAFLRAICEHPDEDTPRLAFADWLDEQGGEANTFWAELIRDQLRPRSQGPTVFLACNDVWHRAWVSRFEFPAALSFDGWKRGFPIRLHAPAGTLRAEWDRIIGLVPVRELDVEDTADANVEDLVAWCDLRNLRELFIQSKTPQENESLLTDRAIVALAECPALSELESLVVRWVGLTDRGAEAVLRSPYLAHLRELRIGRAQNFAATFEVCERICSRFGPKAIH